MFTKLNDLDWGEEYLEMTPTEKSRFLELEVVQQLAVPLTDSGVLHCFLFNEYTLTSRDVRSMEQH